MKRISAVAIKAFWTMVVLVAFILNGAAQETKTLLWEISGNGLQKTSYLFGTIHLMCKEDFVISDGVKDAFAKAEQIALEVDLDNPSEMQAFQAGMVDMAGFDYKGTLSEKDYNRLDEVMKANYGQGMATMRIMKPFGIMSALYGEMMACGTPESYELSFITMAKGQNKEVLGLESAASQVALFDNIPVEEQIGWLSDMLGDSGDSKTEWNQMVASYKAQDLKALYASMGESPEYAKYEKELLDDRNNAWIPKIAELAKDKSTFIAVGAMHLAGGSGVIKLLREAGYTVKPMTN
ncbi:TraB/GumN family protein [Roseivirga sp. E12]|uniref:TraB/GumN family protein n=1 Tax=Roseivirga sp. E12 TaxID=2819237 RepID=UPI001ABCFF54|nr:TraB/GumN family protein [Roseivirga sp. E12]MBO3698161.1 TraB/GumN family protein [Roseivirga sp. E12]